VSAWSPFRIRFLLSSLLVLPPVTAVAQDEAIVDALANVLAAEDARRFDAPLFRAAIRYPSPVVRRQAALAIGRIGNPGGIEFLMRLISDPDSGVQVAAIFALGLVGQPSSLPELRELALYAVDGERIAAGAEAVAAAARIGGPAGAAVIDEVLNRSLGLAARGDAGQVVNRALRESWRLGDYAPVAILTRYVESPAAASRAAAVYSLARLHHVDGAGTLLRSTEDSDPLVRATAVAALDASFADSARINRTAVAARVERLVSDPDRRVRINALRAIATFGGARYVSVVADRAADPDPNVRVQALASLGDMEGPEAIDALTSRLQGGLFSTRRQALLSLAHVQGAAALPAIREWAQSPSWQDRFIAAQALGYLGMGGRDLLRSLLTDGDARVSASALDELLSVDTASADSLAIQFVDHQDVGVRAAAFRALAVRPDTSRLDVLVNGYRRAKLDRYPGARTSILATLGAISQVNAAWRAEVDRRFLTQFPENPDFLERMVVDQFFPDAAAKWGPARPVNTGMSIGDYRDLARELVLPAERGIRPGIVIETDVGTIGIELNSADAPRTVQAFLQMVDRRFFDGTAWHRVVPNFVVQGGDPRGDGTGGPGFTLRDEVINTPFDYGSVGLARGGPDTGGSQFFITLSPQPHLEGAYTRFGEVVSGFATLDRITLGDRIRRVRRR
jgi:cyclophilin family peptidyl-prolyl cis-trans isomerase/HEAT repeat protein